MRLRSRVIIRLVITDWTSLRVSGGAILVALSLHQIQSLFRYQLLFSRDSDNFYTSQDISFQMYRVHYRQNDTKVIHANYGTAGTTTNVHQQYGGREIVTTEMPSRLGTKHRSQWSKQTLIPKVHIVERGEQIAVMNQNCIHDNLHFTISSPIWTV